MDVWQTSDKVARRRRIFFKGFQSLNYVLYRKPNMEIARRRRKFLRIWDAKMYFCKGNSAFQILKSSKFSACGGHFPPPKKIWGGGITQIPPQGLEIWGEITQIPPQGLGIWGGGFSSKSCFPPIMGGEGPLPILSGTWHHSKLKFGFGWHSFGYISEPKVLSINPHPQIHVYNLLCFACA